MVTKLTFQIADIGGGTLSVTPCLDGAPLSTLIKQAYEQHGVYRSEHGGLVPAYYRYGPLDSYLLGRDADPMDRDEPNRIFVLGCACGEVGCNPVTCKVEVLASTITWSAFTAGASEDAVASLGAIEFDREQYEKAVRDLAESKLDW